MKPLFLSSRRGVALVIILGLIVVILGLAVTFLTRARVESTASGSNAAAAATRQLADLAVNLVQAQIQKATTQGSSVAWASQPGMIRTFSDASGGPLLQAFKLYSSGNLVLDRPSVSELLADFTIPTSWAADTALWTDLNSPVVAGNVRHYPILNPAAEGTVEGFTISAPPGTNSVKGQMPVRWLYVLQDGSIVSPGGNGTRPDVPGATTTNPIVGRVAFWTDDETGKVNINTSSEGTYWDTPRADTNEERNLARFQPAQGEFQRYPGHPGMTSIAPVLFATSSTTTGNLTKEQRDAIYSLIPRVNGGGSDAGTVVAPARVPMDTDRLYASVDEMMFAANRSLQAAAAGITPEKIDRARFFLTTSSRAPEVTLFNTPRVSLWPLDAGTTPAFRTPFDRLIAFAATINGFPFYFTRSDPKSPSADYDGIVRNRQLFSYLQELTRLNIPGFGGSFDSKLGTPDRDQLLTNIFDYVRATNLNDSSLPEANRFADRAERIPVANSVNPTTGHTAVGHGFGQVHPIRIGSNQGFGRVPVISEIGIQFIATARTDDPLTTGVDESYGSNNATTNRTLAAATPLTGNQRRLEALFFFETFVPSLANPFLSDAYVVRIRGLNSFSVGGTPLGFPSDATYYSIRPRASAFHGRGFGGSFSHRGSTHESRVAARAQMGNDSGYSAENAYPFISVPFTVDATSGTMNFSGGSLTIDVFARTGSGTTASYNPNAPIQTISVNFPGDTLPIPDLVSNIPPTETVDTPAREFWWTFSRDGIDGPGSLTGRFSRAGRAPGTVATPNSGAIFRSVDVVRSMIPTVKDYRLLSLNLPIPFERHPAWTPGAATNLIHATTENYRTDLIPGRSTSSPLAAGASVNLACQPDVPVPLTPDELARGDWDTGMSFFPDGPYINRPDEGNIRALSAGQLPYFDQSEEYAAVNETFFTPNRQVPSAGMLGSLPSQARGLVNFQTLLFRPQTGHFGANSPPDHLLTDLFWMPVVEPYAISEPFSTAGKINMNYQLAPFGNFITRATGMAALLRSERILAIPASAGPNYKMGANAASQSANRFRLAINNSATLSQFENVFAAGDVFRSPSQIMGLHLVPEGQTVAGMSTFWTTHSLTGDNVRERPYTNLLGRLTTKSNTFTVHYKVQALRKAPGTAPGVWDEARDKVTGEHRGSTVIERYINPNDTTIIDYATASFPLASGADLGAKYGWRVLSVTTFAP